MSATISPPDYILFSSLPHIQKIYLHILHSKWKHTKLNKVINYKNGETCFVIYAHPDSICSLWGLTTPHLPNISESAPGPEAGFQAVAARQELPHYIKACASHGCCSTGGILIISICLYRNILFLLWPPTVISKGCSHCQFITCFLSLASDKLPYFVKYMIMHILYITCLCIYVGTHTYICLFNMQFLFARKITGSHSAW